MLNVQVALLTFGSSGYNELYNGNSGGNTDDGRFITFLYWLCVVLLILVCQNLIIAIVLEAWKRAMDFNDKSTQARHACGLCDCVTAT